MRDKIQLYIHLSISSLGGLEAMLAVTGGEAGYTLDRQPFALSLTPTANLESPITLKCISLEYERKSERPFKDRFESRIFFLCSDSANRCTTCATQLS